MLLVHPAKDDPQHPEKSKLDPSEKWKNAYYRDQKVELAIRSKRDQEVKRSLEVIWGSMGFSSSRAQAKALAKVFKDEWKRRRPREKTPETPAGHGYLRRKADNGIFLGGDVTKTSVIPSRKVNNIKMKQTDEISKSAKSVFLKRLKLSSYLRSNQNSCCDLPLFPSNI